MDKIKSKKCDSCGEFIEVGYFIGDIALCEFCYLNAIKFRIA